MIGDGGGATGGGNGGGDDGPGVKVSFASRTSNLTAVASRETKVP